jgi:cardiolipin synthase C
LREPFDFTGSGIIYSLIGDNFTGEIVFRAKGQRVLLLLLFLWMYSPCQNCSADSIRFLLKETQSLSHRLKLIETAIQSIDLAYFQIRDDDSGGQVLAMLVEAARRGVAVRVIVDGHMGSNSMPKNLMRYLIDNGLQIRERPVDVRYKLELGRARLHDKLFIVDGHTMITGGRNLEEDFFGIDERIYIDFDVVVSGQTATKASDYFQQRWNECVTAQPRLSGKEKSKSLKKQVHKHWNSLSYEQAYCEIDCWLSHLRDAPVQAQEVHCRSYPELVELTVDHVSFLHDCVGGTKRDPASISRQILNAMRSARRSIEICTPYFVISNELQSILREASRRGVKITILTNSLESTDQVIAHAGYANQRRFLVKHGIRVLEFQGKNPLHAKMIVIDGETTFVGSYNLDMLSERRNSEVGILVHDVSFSRQAREVYRTLVSQSDRVDRGELFRLEARQSDASNAKFREFQRYRVVTPFIKRYL